MVERFRLSLIVRHFVLPGRIREVSLDCLALCSSGELEGSWSPRPPPPITSQAGCTLSNPRRAMLEAHLEFKINVHLCCIVKSHTVRGPKGHQRHTIVNTSSSSIYLQNRSICKSLVIQRSCSLNRFCPQQIYSLWSTHTVPLTRA